jgi:WD40 repeat protein
VVLNAGFERSGLYGATEWLIGFSLVHIWYINLFYSAAIAWSPHHHGLLASGGGAADQCIRFWNTLTGQPMQYVNTGSQVSNLAWSKYSSELVSIPQFYSRNDESKNSLIYLTGVDVS